MGIFIVNVNLPDSKKTTERNSIDKKTTDNIVIIDNMCMEERHGLSIPSLDPFLIGMIKVSTKHLLKALRLARVMGDILCKISYEIFGISIDSKYKQSISDGSSLPLLI